MLRNIAVVGVAIEQVFEVGQPEYIDRSLQRVEIILCVLLMERLHGPNGDLIVVTHVWVHRRTSAK